LAIDALVQSIRHYLGAGLVALGGIDVLVFTGGIGENSQVVRKGVCEGLAWAGIELDEKKNNVRCTESRISTDQSKAQIWIMPTNEELIVARQTMEALKN
jgi:acetate kinase